MAVGTYWVKELSPSTNYQLDAIAHQVTTQANQTISAGISSEPFNYGGNEVQMRSGNTDMTNGNRCYSLAGGVYTIYRDIACTKRVMDMTTDANGYATTKGQSGEHNIVFGTYWVKETKAPKGYVLDSRVVSVTFDKFDSNGTVKRISSSGDALVYAVPKSGSISLVLEKRNADADGAGVHDSESLAGAKFEVTYYDVAGVSDQDEVNSSVAQAIEVKAKIGRTWNFETLHDGKVVSAYDVPTVGGHLYKNGDGTNCFPIGVLVIREIAPPSGQVNTNEGKYWIRSMSGDGNSKIVKLHNQT